MNAEFWQRFGADYTANCAAWRHAPDNPVLPAAGTTWKSCWTANPDVLEWRGRHLLYYRGNGVLPGTDGQRHDRIAAAEITSLSGSGLVLRPLNDDQPVIDVGPPGAFDADNALDPAALAFGGQVWLYYSATGPGPDSVGLARSADGEHFAKVGKVITGRAPEVVLHDGQVHMLYQRLIGQSYQLYLAASADGEHFVDVVDRPVFGPAAGGWDSLSITTSRVSREGDWFYMIYGGSAYLADEPDYFGLARSRNLIDWERHPGNPVFGCGAKGTPDGGALWFPALVQTEDSFVMLYEGSRGKYSWDLSSAICLADIPRT